VGKKKCKKAPSPEVSPADYARRLARGGAASVDLLDRYRVQVVADPDRWATPYGATEAEMLAGIDLLRAVVMAETLNAAVASAGV
jgi:hypothetical protein